jgi:hypothetical protein
MLITVHTIGNTPDYASWRQEHLPTEQHLKDRGLLCSHNGPHHAELHPDVAISLVRHE